jgi:hypothetical protein
MNVKPLIFAIYFLLDVTYAGQVNVYHSSQGNFSLSIPEQFVQLPKEYAQQATRSMSGFMTDFGGRRLEVDAIFCIHGWEKQKTQDKVFDSPIVIISWISGFFSQKDIASWSARRQVRQGVERTQSKMHSINSVSLDTIDYNKETYILSIRMHTDITGAGAVNLFSAVVLGDKGIAVVYLYSHSLESAEENFTQIMRSFTFDKGYEYSRGGADRIKAAMPWLLGFFTGLIVIVSNLIRRRIVTEANVDLEPDNHKTSDQSIPVPLSQKSNPAFGQICQNCDKIIRANERSFTYKSYLVCHSCYIKLIGLNTESYVQVNQPTNADSDPDFSSPTQLQAKNKTLAVLLAVFTGPFAWLYISRFNHWKFWLDIFFLILLFPFWWFGGWIWPLLDVLLKPVTYYENYGLIGRTTK